MRLNKFFDPNVYFKNKYYVAIITTLSKGLRKIYKKNFSSLPNERGCTLIYSEKNIINIYISPKRFINFPTNIHFSSIRMKNISHQDTYSNQHAYLAR